MHIIVMHRRQRSRADPNHSCIVIWNAFAAKTRVSPRPLVRCRWRCGKPFWALRRNIHHAAAATSEICTALAQVYFPLEAKRTQGRPVTNTNIERCLDIIIRIAGPDDHERKKKTYTFNGLTPSNILLIVHVGCQCTVVSAKTHHAGTS